MTELLLKFILGCNSRCAIGLKSLQGREVKCKPPQDIVVIPDSAIVLCLADVLAADYPGEILLHDGTYLWYVPEPDTPVEVMLQDIRTLAQAYAVNLDSSYAMDAHDQKLMTMICVYYSASSVMDSAIGFRIPDDTLVLSMLNAVPYNTTAKVSNIPGTPFYIADIVGSRDTPLVRYKDKVFLSTREHVVIFAGIAMAMYKLLHGYMPCSDDVSNKALHYCRDALLPLMHMYSPITSGYIDVMDAITDSTTPVYVNPKYNGVPQWLYWDKVSGVIAVNVKKVKNTYEYKVLGKYTRTPLPKDYECDSVCILTEVTDTTRFAVDLFYGKDEPYYIRRGKLDYLCSLLPDIVKITQGAQTNMSEAACLPQLMRKPKAATDGLVVYVQGHRPMKLKPANQVTVDITYHSNGTWEYELPGIGPIPDDMLLAADEQKGVYEISLATKKILRRRYDREDGNPRGLIEHIVNKFETEKSYASYTVWSGNDPAFAVVANRMFKRRVYSKYIQPKSRIVDVGSGYGADLTIWKQRKYRVIAIEKSEVRYKELTKKVKEYSAVLTVHDDMAKLNVFEEQYQGYNTWVFMRSINAITHEQKARLICDLMKKKATIVIVATVLDNVKEVLQKSASRKYTGVYTKQEITMSVEGRDFTLMHTTSHSNTQEPKREYVDHLCTIDEWKAMAEATDYSVEVYTSAEFLKDVYGTNSMQIMEICKIDSAVIYRPK